MNVIRPSHAISRSRLARCLLLTLALAASLPARAQYNRSGRSDRYSRSDRSSRSDTSNRTDISASTNAFSRADLTSFRLITDRNIFNPNRTPSRPQRYDMPVTRATYSRSDSFAFVGTLESEKGQFAFFDGTSSSFRRAVRAHDTNTIAGFAVIEISPTQVKLARDTNTIELKIGMQMRHGEGDAWFPYASTDGVVGSPSYASLTIVAPTPAFVTRTDSVPSNGPMGDLPPPPGFEGMPQPPDQAAGAGPTVAAPAAAPGAPSSPNDVLQRLMQRREQEMNR